MFVKRRIPLWQRLFNIRHHSRTHTARLRRRISDELYGRAHSHRAADPADVLESSIIFSGKHSHPGIYRMSQFTSIRLSEKQFSIADISGMNSTG